MNGDTLSQPHGFPIRAIVPGYYGVASVKWLRRLVVTKTPFRGYFQTIDYAVWREDHGIPVRVPLLAMSVKSQISRPAIGEALPVGAPYLVRGAAWTGGAEITSVEFSWDAERWINARLLGEPVPNAWRLWECETTVPSKPGRYQAYSRATDSKGRTQPLSHDQRNYGYVVHFIVPINVEVVDTNRLTA
jgi:DMSO/TMAO reductase YedYZ molybdopterin-dependent catalytic subunit